MSTIERSNELRLKLSTLTERECTLVLFHLLGYLYDNKNFLDTVERVIELQINTRTKI